MTFTALQALIASCGVPTAYREWPDNAYDPLVTFPAGAQRPAAMPPRLPWIVWYEDGSDDFYADNANYASISRVVIELYTRHKEPTVEAALQQVLTSAGIPWAKTESALETDGALLEIYNIEVLISG